MSEFVKLKNNRPKRSNPLWYDNHLQNQISKRSKLQTRFTRAHTSDNFSKFKHSRKHVKALLKLKKKQYYNQLFKSSLEDKQSFFRNSNNFLGRKNRRSLVTSLYVNKKEINKDSEIAESFNEHFTTVGAKLLSELQQDQINDLNHIEMTPFSCYCKRTTLNEVLSILKILKENKSVGPDGIPSEVLKISSSVIGPYLVQLISWTRNFPELFENCHSQTSLQIRRSSKFEQLQTHFSFTCNLERF